MALRDRIIPSCFPSPFPSLLLLLLLLPLTIAKFRNGPSVSVPALWTVDGSFFDLSDGESNHKVLLYRLNSGPSFFLGLICFDIGNCGRLGLYMFQPTEDVKNIRGGSIALIYLLDEAFLNSTAQLLLTQEGDSLILLGDNGNKIWSANTDGKSVVSLNLTEVGNLVLYDRNDAIVWQSFDHPTNRILPGQELRPGMTLTTPTDLPNVMGRFYTFAIDDHIGFVASVTGVSSPQIYYRTSNVSKMKSDSGQVIAPYKNESFGEFHFLSTSSAQFISLGFDGHLTRFIYEVFSNRYVMEDLYQIDDCHYPLVCGSYGICSYPRQCRCPNETQQITLTSLSTSCNRSSPFSCDSHNNSFVEIADVTFFTLRDNDTIANLSNTTAESCKEECLRKGCSCSMALFRNRTNFFGGDCYLLSGSFSLTDETYGQHSTSVFIKVNHSSNAPMPSSIFQRKKRGRMVLIVGTTVGAVSMFLISILGIYISSTLRRNNVEDDDPDLQRLQISRFSYEDLKAMTGDFNTKLGEGGFGSVFLGTLTSGLRIAVKRLHGFDQIKKSFLAEAKTLGTIHHVNLVRLLGFCADKSHRLLVYEYMCNGSLDKWIFHNNQEFDVCWQVRRKIILDIAKGLAYLHEECHQKIIHLDIKPQNILLDEHFNAKLADFGLSKLIDKDQSHVMTTMQGTPGYLAPEWLSSIITEKVDVYSFGIVMLEVLCGRKNIDRSLPSDEVYMLTLFKCKAEQEQLLEMVDKSSGDMQLYGQEAVKMMKIATWCLQDDSSKRPPMSRVVKCLEGSANTEDCLRLSFSVPFGHSDHSVDDATQLSPSELSGPR